MLEKQIYANTAMDKECIVSTFCTGNIAIYSRPHDTDSPNEDALAVFCYDNQTTILVIADGMGGTPGGRQASFIAIESLRLSLENQINGNSNLRENILNGIEDANDKIISLGVGAGSTLAIAEINNNILRPYHIGDSIIMVVSQRGNIKFQTIAHSPVGYAYEAGVLSESEALQHEERHLISNMLGDTEMRIDIGPAIKLARYDTVLIASDGLYDNLRTDEIIHIIRRGALKKAAGKLIEDSLERMHYPDKEHPSKPDDLSFILYRRNQ